jgi:YfiR/HmsC-like
MRHALACIGVLLAIVGHAAAVPEHQVKLALTYKVAKFVSWPAEREAGTTFTLCVLGEDPFGEALGEIENLKVKDRTIRIERLAALGDDAELCDLMFISRSEADTVADLLAELEGRPVLTISDLPRFAEKGGIVELQNRDNRVGFEINVAAYKRAGLVISSQLLQLATLLDGSEGANR